MFFWGVIYPLITYSNATSYLHSFDQWQNRAMLGCWLYFGTLGMRTDSNRLVFLFVWLVVWFVFL